MIFVNHDHTRPDELKIVFDKVCSVDDVSYIEKAIPASNLCAQG